MTLSLTATAPPTLTPLTAPPTTSLTTTPIPPHLLPPYSTLPAHTPLTYLAEGAANIIFRSPSTPGLLLRLRKTLPSSQPTVRAYSFLSHTAFPLFPADLLISTHLVALPPGLLKRANKLLRSAPRPAKRRGLLLDETETHGLLVRDMSARPGEAGVEFKLKWVCQSRSAPAGWRRCRTCALRAKKGQPRGMCPLDVASGEPGRVERAVRRVVEGEEVVAAVTRWLVGEKGRELVRVLRENQERLDPRGPGASSDEDMMGVGYCTAMTLRDCTVFLVCRGGEVVRAGVGDLDLKIGGMGKVEYWRRTERELIEEGWYMGRGLEPGEEGCHL